MLILTRRVGETLMFLCIVRKFTNVSNMNVPCMSICNILIKIFNILLKKIITIFLEIITSIVNTQYSSPKIKATILSRFNCFYRPKAFFTGP